MLINQCADQVSHGITLVTPQDMAKSRAWVSPCFSTAANLPISFTLSGKTVQGIPAAWQSASQHRRIDANISETVFEGTDAKTGLNICVECWQYYDYPVIEWVARFTNQGHEPSPLLSDIHIIDGVIKGVSPVLYHCNGDFYSAEGYRPEETPLMAGDVLSFSPHGGCPCDGAFPYYRLGFDGWGISLAIGWPAQWAVRFEGLAEGLKIQAGQEKISLRLLPGETIRTPRLPFLTWSGDRSRVVSLWRRWYLAHILPRPNGQPMKPLLACAATDDGEEFTAATEANQIRFIEKFYQNGIQPDVWWIEAGWYPCFNQNHERKWPITGTWEPDPERFPNDFTPVSDQAAQNGADLLVWFEPERVVKGTQIEIEHPEWLLRTHEGGE